MSVLPEITTTLTAQLMAELAVKNRLPTGQLLLDVQEFDRLVAEAMAELSRAVQPVGYLKLERDTPAAVALVSHELKLLFGHDYDLTSKAGVDEWLAERRFFALGWHDLYGPKMHLMYQLDGSRTESYPITEAFYNLLLGARYEDVPAGYQPPIIAAEVELPDYAALIRQADDNLALRLVLWMKSEGLLDDAPAPKPVADNTSDIGRILPVLDEIYATLEPGGIQVLAEEKTQRGQSYVGKSKSPRNEFEITRWANRDKSLGSADFYVSLRVRVRKRTRTYLYRFLAGFTGSRLVSFEAHDADLRKRYAYRDYANALLNLGFAEPLARKYYKEQFRPKRTTA